MELKSVLDEDIAVGVVLDAGAWRLGNYTFASGKKANNKFDMPRILDYEPAAEFVLGAMGKIIEGYEPQALWGVPQGGQQFAEKLSRIHNLPLVRLRKVGEGPQSAFEYDSSDSQDLAAESETMVGVEDLINELTNTRKALKLPRLSQNTSAIVAGWVRGLFVRQPGEFFDVKGVIVKPVPNEISPSHPFYRRYSKLAVHEGDQL